MHKNLRLGDKHCIETFITVSHIQFYITVTASEDS